MEIDMTREPVSAYLTGTNLWECRECKQDRSQKGDPMLRFKFKSGEYELNDIAMLSGGGWGIGKNKLIALGMSPTFKGTLDPLDFVGRRVWIATVEGSFAGVDKKTGAAKTFRRLEVDINALDLSGYQEESKKPAGATVAVAGAGPPDDETPF